MAKSLSLLAFEALYTKLNPGTSPVSLTAYNTHTKTSPSDYPLSAPLFITWNKHDQLRGCIGTFQLLKVETGVQRYALTAALDDTRFAPINKNELNSSLSVSVTLLDNFTPIKTPLEWQVGVHGLKLQFEYDSHFYSGTFLPSVAEEQEWDQVTTLWHLLRKADLDLVLKSKTIAFYEKGLREGWLELTRYDGLKDGLNYDEFLEARGAASS